jgi:hypothetical protein
MLTPSPVTEQSPPSLASRLNESAAGLVTSMSIKAEVSWMTSSVASLATTKGPLPLPASIIKSVPMRVCSGTGMTSEPVPPDVAV